MTDCVLRTAYRVGAGGLGFRVWIPWAAAFVLAAGVPAAALAQDASSSGARISFTADRAELTVGDIVTLTLEVTHSADQVVVVPRLSPEWGPFEVRSQTPAQAASNGDGTETMRQRLQVTLFAPGIFETPAFPVSVRRPDGSLERVFPPPVRLTVRSVLSSPDEPLKDIRPPADLSMPLWEQPAARAMAALAALVALGVVAYFLYRRSSRREAPPAPLIDTRTPWEVAAQELDRIERLDLLGEGRFKEHYTLVASAVSAYVHTIYLKDARHPDVTGMTTNEIGAAMWGSSLDRKNTRLVVDLLLEADLVRFSNHAPPVSQAYEAWGQARRIVEDLRPSVEEAQGVGHTQPEAST